MKRNKLFILGICTVLVAMLSLSFVSGTWAKYTSSVSGSDSARVALWKWEISDNKAINSSSEITFDLFSTINDENVKDGGDVNIIAPGTSGEFEFVINNKSEVNATYAIDYTVTNANDIPVVFSTDGNTWGELKDVTATPILMETGTATIKVQWKWLYEQTDIETGDKADNTLGFAGTATIEVKAEVTVVQVD